MTPELYLLIALAVGYTVGRLTRTGRDDHVPRIGRGAASFQNRGEALLSSALRAHFRYPDFHILNHVTLRLPDGTTQIDHILVSRFGVFVIETKDYSGWIFASATHKHWTQVLYKQKHTFQNPLHQNFRHVVAVRQLLDFLPPDSIKPVVVFTGDAEFKTDVPAGVFTVDELIRHIHCASVPVMSLNRLQFCVGRLETARLAISGETDVEHVLSLQRRHGTVA